VRSIVIGSAAVVAVALAFGALACRREAEHASPAAATAAPSPRSATATPQAVATRAAAGAPPIAPPPADGSSAARAPAPADDAPSRREVRGLIARVLDGRLPDRQLTARDYDRLTDAVLRLRAANRTTRDAGETSDAATLNAQQQAALSALTDIETITGIPPSELGELFAADERDAGSAGAATPHRAR